MSFTLPQRARKYFQVVTERNRHKYLMFDSWYACALLGLRERKLGKAEDLEGEPFNPNYPEEFKPQADFIAGLLIDAELERNRIDITRKSEVEAEMVLLLDPSSNTGLSAKGMDILNRYAVGGFLLIEDTLSAPPANIEDLLVAYAGVWRQEDGER